MTLVITWEHVAIIVGVLTALGGLVSWLINRFDNAQEKERTAIREEIQEKEEFDDRARSEIKTQLKAAWEKIDHLMAQSVERKELDAIRSEFREDMDRWGNRIEAAISNLGMRVDNIAAKVRHES